MSAGGKATLLTTRSINPQGFDWHGGALIRCYEGLCRVGKTGTRSDMKKQTTDHTTPHRNLNLTPTPPADKPAVRQVFKLGLDVDLKNTVVATQCHRGRIPPARKLFRPQLLTWVRQQVAAGHIVYTVYEACGFGYTLHEELTAAGAHSLVTTPMRLSLERRRKNDRLDARELCVRLSRHLDGHPHELQPIRIPSRDEQQRREPGRQREFWKRELHRLENHGRALRIEFEHQTLPAGWGCSDLVRGHYYDSLFLSRFAAKKKHVIPKGTRIIPVNQTAGKLVRYVCGPR